MKQISTIIFDLDGTLMDSLQDLANSVNFTLQTMNLPQRSIDEIREFVGNGVRMLVVRALQASLQDIHSKQLFTDELVENALQCFRTHYTVHCKENTKPYDGIMEMLHDLHSHGFKLAIVSNKPQKGVSILQKDFFSDYVSVAIGENEAEGIAKKPAPDMVNKALLELHDTKENAIYVGDSDVDIATAQNAGLQCISVLWGFRSKEFLLHHGATLFASSPSEIVSLVSE